MELLYGFIFFWNKFYVVSEQEFYFFGGSFVQGIVIYSIDGG